MDNLKKLIEIHFDELSKIYQYLTLKQGNDSFIVWGVLEFEAVYNNISIQDLFLLDIIIPLEYNNSPPEVKETGGRIPRNFHTNHDGFLCLASPLEIKMKFANDPSLLGFVNNLVIPFLYSFCYWENNNIMPFGELSHGTKGLMESYLNLLKVDSESKVIKLLRLLLTTNYNIHLDCPCGSGKKFRQCHREILLKLKKYQNETEFFKDLLKLEKYLKDYEWKYSSRYLLVSKS